MTTIDDGTHVWALECGESGILIVRMLDDPMELTMPLSVYLKKVEL